MPISTLASSVRIFWKVQHTTQDAVAHDVMVEQRGARVTQGHDDDYPCNGIVRLADQRVGGL